MYQKDHPMRSMKYRDNNCREKQSIKLRGRFEPQGGRFEPQGDGLNAQFREKFFFFFLDDQPGRPRGYC